MNIRRDDDMSDVGRTISRLVLGVTLNGQCRPSPITGELLPRIRYCPRDSPPGLLGECQTM